jgi:S1-C subfamily serine protease
VSAQESSLQSDFGGYCGALFLIIIMLAGIAAAAYAEVYKWTDAKGQVQYSDRPPPEQLRNARVLGVQGSTAGLEGACSAVAAAVPQLMFGLRRTLSASEASAVGDVVDERLAQEGMDNTNFKRLLGMLYAFKVDGQTYGNLQQAQLEVKNACLVGRFGHFDAKKNNAAQASTHKSMGSGTGFWVDSNRVATSWHVVKNATSIRVTDAKGNSHRADVIAQDVEHDLAVLRVFGADWPTRLKFASAEAGLGADVFTIGFPQTDILGIKPKLSTGVISSRFGFQDDPRTYQISVPVQAGNSGGPLINQRGEVVGVIASKLNAREVFDWTGDLPQNVNYAAKSNPLIGLLGAVANRSAVAGVGAEALAPQVELTVVLIRVEQ